MKILVYGAGVQGSLYAAWLQEAGHDVTVLARGQRLEDVGKHGILLEDMETYHFTITKVKAIETLAPDDAYDLIAVFVRRHQILEVLPVLSANNSPDVLFIGNNASGAEPYAAALGRQRVLFGFGNVAGYLEGKVVHAVGCQKAKCHGLTLGEIDGQLTPRLRRIADAFEAAGIGVELSTDIDAWLKTHAALISPVANALYLAGGDNYRLANTRDGLLLLVCAVREGFKVLRALGIPITPKGLRLLEFVPEPFLISWIRRQMDTKWARMAMARHANVARDEMKEVADEFWALARATAVPTPAMDRLYQYIDPDAPTVPEGSADIPLDYRGVWATVASAAGLLLGGYWLYRRLTRPKALPPGQ